MPEWASTLVWTLLGVAVTTIIGLLVKDMWHDKITVPKQRLEDYAELEKHRQIQKEFEPTIECINNKLDQVTQSMDDISESLKVDRSATVSLLRDRMKCSLEYCKKQGYATSTDVSNWKELYNSYKALGGNHFKEYVNSWYQEMERLREKGLDKE